VIHLFEVKFSNNAEKFIKKTNLKTKNHLRDLFFIMHKNPVPIKNFDIRKLSGSDSTYRIRLGRIRITYAVFWDANTIRVLKIGKRKESTYKR